MGDNYTKLFYKADDVFNHTKIEDYAKLLNIVNQVKKINIDELISDYKQGNISLKPVWNQWYESLERNNPDYSVYSNDFYLNEVFACWKTYSRRYLINLRKYINSDSCDLDITSINGALDLGCGVAYSTVALSSLFSNAKVYGTNMNGSVQYEVDKIVTNNFNNITIVDESMTFDLQNIDLVFASEFFEHVENPIDFLIKLIESYKPKYFVIANTFTQPAIGHFNSYMYKGESFSGMKMTRLFNSIMKKYGYCQIRYKFWNNRPVVWKLTNDITDNRLF